jgi:uncharacterized membrane protein (GlpM family)
MEYVLRFLIGGSIVSLFAVFGDVLRPKSAAGLLGAAPSVALATLGLAYWKHGPGYVATESLSMMIGAIALGIYSFAVCQLLMRAKLPALAATGISLVAWLAVALGLERVLIG